MNYKLSDFKVGDRAYIELVGNAKRDRTREELIQECVVEKVTKKYVTAGGHKFEEHERSNYGGLREHTPYKVSYVLYPNKQDVENKVEKDKLIATIKSLFTGARTCKADDLTLEKLRKINEIINS